MHAAILWASTFFMWQIPVQKYCLTIFKYYIAIEQSFDSLNTQAQYTYLNPSCQNGQNDVKYSIHQYRCEPSKLVYVFCLAYQSSEGSRNGSKPGIRAHYFQKASHDNEQNLQSQESLNM